MSSDKSTLEKMLDCIAKIEKYTYGLSVADFVLNDMAIDACVFNLGQLGEYAHKVSDVFRTNHPDIPWKDIYGLRNRIFHDYEGVNLHLIWEIIQDDLPELQNSLSALLMLF